MKINLLGVKVNTDPKIQILQQIANLIRQGKPIFITTPYSESVVAAQRDKEFREILNSADLALPDGIGILWAAHFLRLKISGSRFQFLEILVQLISSLLSIIFNPKSIRHPIPEKISGSEFIWDLAEFAAKNNYSVFLLGGFGETPAIVAKILKTRFPNLKIAGISNFPSSPGDARDRGEVEKINHSQTDFLLVTLGHIRQEKWIFQNLPNLRVKLAIGLGGTFDYLARKRPYRPKIWALRGLEWLWRLLTQPWRAVRIFRAVLGLTLYCLSDKISKSR